METTETTHPSLDGLSVSDGFSLSGDTGTSGDFVIVTDPAGGSEATINERWYRLYSHSKAMCELMVAFNTELEPGYAPQGLGVAVHDQLSKLENLVSAARILITPAVAATGQWKREGAKNPEDWFAGKTGKSRAKARTEMETGKNLGNAPGTREAFKNGELSAEQADTIADAVEANPEAEQALLDAAKKQSLKELKDEAARRKAEVEDMEKRERRIHKGRYVRTWTDSHGAWNLHAKGTIPDGADFLSVLERLIDQQFKQARKNGVRGTRDNYAFDALMNMAAQHGKSGFGAGGHDNPGPANPGDPGPTKLRPARPAPNGNGPTEPGKTDPGKSDPGKSDSGRAPRRPQGRGQANAGPVARGPERNDSGRAEPKPTPQGPRERGRAAGSPSPGGTTRSASRSKPPDSDASDSTESSPTPPGPLGATERAMRASAAESSTRSTLPISQRQIYCIDWTALVRGRARIGERSELRGFGPVSVSAIRRAVAAGTAKLLVMDDAGRPVTVAHLGTGAINTRLIPGLASNATTPAGTSCDNATNAGGTLVIIGIRASDLAAARAGHDPTTQDSQDKRDSQDTRTTSISGLGEVSRDRVLQLLGTEATARLVSRGQAVRDQSYAGRAPNAAQRVALAWTDTTCKVEGCPNQRIEIDHRTPWATERVTELDNLDPLCAYHHSLKTNQGWRFVDANSGLFVGPENLARHAEDRA